MKWFVLQLRLWWLAFQFSQPLHAHRYLAKRQKALHAAHKAAQSQAYIAQLGLVHDRVHATRERVDRLACTAAQSYCLGPKQWRPLLDLLTDQDVEAIFYEEFRAALLPRRYPRRKNRSVPR